LLLAGAIIPRFDPKDEVCKEPATYSAIETSFNEIKEAMLRDSSEETFPPISTV